MSTAASKPRHAGLRAKALLGALAIGWALLVSRGVDAQLGVEPPFWERT